MSPLRTTILIVAVLLLAAALVAAQCMMLVQRTAVKTAFLLPHVERAFSAIGTPEAHEELVRYIMDSTLRTARARIPIGYREPLLEASVAALSPPWIQEEILQILNKALAVLRGRSQSLTHTIYLSRRKDMLVAELARRLPAEQAAEIRAGSSMVPDAVELEDIVGKDVIGFLVLLGRRYILFSLLFIYVVPIVLAALVLQLGRMRFAVLSLGAAALLSGVLFLALLGRAFGPLEARFILPALRGLPEAFRWVRDLAGELLEGARGVGRDIGTVSAACGGAVLLSGVTLAVLLRRAGA